MRDNNSRRAKHGKMGMLLRHPPFAFGLLGKLAYFDRLFELEGQGSLGRQSNLLVAGKSRPGGACPTAGRRANSCSLAAAGQSADQRSRSGAAANEAGRTLAFAFRSEEHTSEFQSHS